MKKQYLVLMSFMVGVLSMKTVSGMELSRFINQLRADIERRNREIPMDRILVCPEDFKEIFKSEENNKEEKPETSHHFKRAGVYLNFGEADEQFVTYEELEKIVHGMESKEKPQNEKK